MHARDLAAKSKGLFGFFARKPAVPLSKRATEPAGGGGASNSGVSAAGGEGSGGGASGLKTSAAQAAARWMTKGVGLHQGENTRTSLLAAKVCVQFASLLCHSVGQECFALSLCFLIPCCDI